MSGIGATVYVVLRKVHNFLLHKTPERCRESLVIFNKFFEVDGLITKLPEVMVSIVLITIGEELE